MGNILKWVEAHPAESAIIGVGGVVVVMWMLGFFSSAPASSADSGSANMAAAYYAAEAQQAVVGGQIQVATIAAAASTAQAVAGDTAAVQINGQNTNASIKMTKSNNATAATIADQANQTSLLAQYINSILPTELLQSNGMGIQTSIPGVKGTFTTGFGVTPSQAASLGYGPAYLASIGGA